MDCKDQILSPEYWDFIVPQYREGIRDVYPEETDCVLELGFGYRAVYVHEKRLGEISFDKYGYNGIPAVYGLTDAEAMREAGITEVQDFPALGLGGKNVMIGFVDTGIDYSHPVFRKSDGKTRIEAVWDQTIQTGIPPEGFVYGSEYTREQIDEDLRKMDGEVVPGRDDNGHGTFLASVAAGGEDRPQGFIGAAPESTIAVVKLKAAKDNIKDFYGVAPNATCYEETDILSGLKYLNELALKKKMPLVMCLALGTNLGGHNGLSILSRVLEEYANTTERCVVVGTGNEASQRHHYSGQISNAGQSREVEFRVGEGCSGFVLELWTTLPNVMTVYLVSPTGEQTPKISVRQGSRYSLSFVFDRTQVILEYRLLIDNNDSQLIFMRFYEPSPGLWRVGVEPVYALDGEFHLWLSMEPFLDGDVFFLESNPDVTLTEPSTARGIITAAYYNGRENSVDINSGRGYTRGKQTKPDLAAPGVKVKGAVPGGGFSVRSGSSVASGITAGGACLIIQWLKSRLEVREITTSQILNIMILGTEQSVLPQYPNREWGYGTLDIYQSLERLRKL